MSPFKNVWPGPEEERSGAWKRKSLLVEIVFFFLTTIAIGAASIFPGVVVLVVCVGVAEWLIQGKHFWRTGIESALWIGGIYSFIFHLPHSGRPEALLVLAAGAALAGFRVRNALFGTLAACLVLAYFEERHWPMLIFAFAISILALFAQTRARRRPSTDRLWQMLLLVMPVAGYIALIVSNMSETWMVFLPLSAICAFVGIRWRLRVPLIASAIALTIAAIDAKLPLALETQLIIGGAIALAVAAAVTRVLRRRTTGFVLDIPGQSDLEALMIAGGQAILPVPHSTAAAPQMTPQGGDFGGAGASGNF